MKLTFSRLLILLNGLVPLALLIWDVYHKRVGANPVDFMTRTTGMLTLIFLMISIAVTPIRKITGINQIVKFRRLLGLLRLLLWHASLADLRLV